MKYKAGAWAFIVINPISGEIIKKACGEQNESTSNQCELSAIINSLDFVEEGEEVHIVTDSYWGCSYPLNIDLISANTDAR